MPYRTDWGDFVQWCVARGEPALPAAVESVTDYLADLAADGQGSSIERRLAAISDAHEEVGLPSPTDDARVRVEVTRLRWQRRRSGTRGEGRARRQLRALVEALPPGLTGTRDRALLLIAHGARMRPSELAALDVSDLVLVEGGLSVARMRGRVVIPLDESEELSADDAWREWVAAAGLTGGPAFRAVDRSGRIGLNRLSERTITDIMQRAAERAGVEASRLPTGS